MDNKKKYAIKKTPERNFFDLTYTDFSDTDILKEILFYQKKQTEKTERIRKNTSILVWWLIVIPFIVGILFFMFSS